MDISYKQNGITVNIVINGNIDTKGGEKLTETLNEIMKIENIKHVVFDLTTVITTTSSGIGKLLRIYKHINAIGGTMVIKGISDNLYTQFQEIHLERIFTIIKE